MELYSSESWEYSRNYASLLGEIPSSFSSTIRSLLNDAEKNGNSLSPGSRYLATRIIKSGSMKAPFYYAAQTYKPEDIAALTAISDNDLVKIFKPDEMATLFGIIYLYKKVKKYVDSGELAFITPSLHKDLFVAGHVGVSIPAIGFSRAILTYGMRYIAVATFLKHNVKHFQEFRRLLKNEKSIFNLQKEVEYFGCTVPQIASIFLQTLGFGINYANDFAMAFSNEALLTKTAPDSSPFKVTELWTNTISQTGKEPQIVHDSKYYPKNAAVLSSMISRSIAPALYWLDKAPEDLSPSSTPKLFAVKSLESTKVVEDQLSDATAKIGEDLEKIDEI